MAIKVNTIKCPACGADLTVEEGRSQCFCSYCGTKVIITNENEYVYRNIDEAKVKEAETDRIIKLKNLELKEKNKQTKIKISIGIGIVSLFSFIIGGIFDFYWIIYAGLFGIIFIAYMWLFEMKNDNDPSDGKIRVPDGISDYTRKSYQSIEALFKTAGFTNIECIPLHDLRMGLLSKPNTVESITINGTNRTGIINRYEPDAKIVITYHSF